MGSLMAGLFENHPVLLSLLGGASLLMFVGSLIAVPLVIVRLPKDYLRREQKLIRDLMWSNKKVHSVKPLSQNLLLFRSRSGSCILKWNEDVGNYKTFR